MGGWVGWICSASVRLRKLLIRFSAPRGCLGEQTNRAYVDSVASIGIAAKHKLTDFILIGKESMRRVPGGKGY